MPTAELTRAWVDADFRSALTEDEMASMPANPAGELLDDLGAVDPELPGVYNSWVPCFFSLEKTDSCCAY